MDTQNEMPLNKLHCILLPPHHRVPQLFCNGGFYVLRYVRRKQYHWRCKETSCPALLITATASTSDDDHSVQEIGVGHNHAIAGTASNLKLALMQESKIKTEVCDAEEAKVEESKVPFQTEVPAAENDDTDLIGEVSSLDFSIPCTVVLNSTRDTYAADTATNRNAKQLSIAHSLYNLERCCDEDIHTWSCVNAELLFCGSRVSTVLDAEQGRHIAVRGTFRDHGMRCLENPTLTVSNCALNFSDCDPTVECHLSLAQNGREQFIVVGQTYYLKSMFFGRYEWICSFYGDKQCPGAVSSMIANGRHAVIINSMHVHDNHETSTSLLTIMEMPKRRYNVVKSSNASYDDIDIDCAPFEIPDTLGETSSAAVGEDESDRFFNKQSMSIANESTMYPMGRLNECIVMPTKYGNEKLLVNGHTFHYKSRIRGRTRWRCTYYRSQKCTSTFVTIKDENGKHILKSPLMPHSHKRMCKDDVPQAGNDDSTIVDPLLPNPSTVEKLHNMLADEIDDPLQMSTDCDTPSPQPDETAAADADHDIDYAHLDELTPCRTTLTRNNKEKLWIGDYAYHYMNSNNERLRWRCTEYRVSRCCSSVVTVKSPVGLHVIQRGTSSTHNHPPQGPDMFRIDRKRSWSPHLSESAQSDLRGESRSVAAAARNVKLERAPPIRADTLLETTNVEAISQPCFEQIDMDIKPPSVQLPSTRNRPPNHKKWPSRDELLRNNVHIPCTITITRHGNEKLAAAGYTYNFMGRCDIRTNWRCNKYSCTKCMCSPITVKNDNNEHVLISSSLTPAHNHAPKEEYSGEHGPVKKTSNIGLAIDDGTAAWSDRSSLRRRIGPRSVELMMKKKRFTKCTIARTTKGNEKLVVDGFVFHFKSGRGVRTNWRCKMYNRSKCMCAPLTIKDSNGKHRLLTASLMPHNHERDAQDIEESIGDDGLQQMDVDGDDDSADSDDDNDGDDNDKVNVDGFTISKLRIKDEPNVATEVPKFSECTIETTIQGNEKLLANGYVFHFRSTRGDQTTWRCKKYKQFKCMCAPITIKDANGKHCLLTESMLPHNHGSTAKTRGFKGVHQAIEYNGNDSSMFADSTKTLSAERLKQEEQDDDKMYTKCTIGTTIQGKEKLIVDGYVFHFRTFYNGRTNWRCKMYNQYKCMCSPYTVKDANGKHRLLTASLVPHNHGRSKRDMGQFEENDSVYSWTALDEEEEDTVCDNDNNVDPYELFNENGNDVDDVYDTKECTTISSIRGKDKLLADGYVYYHKSSSENGNRTTWRCSMYDKKKCPATVKTIKDELGQRRILKGSELLHCHPRENDTVSYTITEENSSQSMHAKVENDVDDEEDVDIEQRDGNATTQRGRRNPFLDKWMRNRNVIKCTTTDTYKGNSAISLNGYTYYFMNGMVNDEWTHWRCKMYKRLRCQVSPYTIKDANGDHMILKESLGQHNHPAEKGPVRIRKHCLFLPCTVMVTAKGSQKLWSAGFTYHCTHSQGKHNSWRCSQYSRTKCRGGVRTVKNASGKHVILKASIKQHNHGPAAGCVPPQRYQADEMLNADDGAVDDEMMLINIKNEPIDEHDNEDDNDILTEEMLRNLETVTTDTSQAIVKYEIEDDYSGGDQMMNVYGMFDSRTPTDSPEQMTHFIDNESNDAELEASTSTNRQILAHPETPPASQSAISKTSASDRIDELNIPTSDDNNERDRDPTLAQLLHNNLPVPFEFRRSSAGKETLAISGFTYEFVKHYKSRSFWRCSNNSSDGCPSSLFTANFSNGQRVVLSATIHPHNHSVDGDGECETILDESIPCYLVQSESHGDDGDNTKTFLRAMGYNYYLKRMTTNRFRWRCADKSGVHKCPATLLTQLNDQQLHQIVAQQKVRAHNHHDCNAEEEQADSHATISKSYERQNDDIDDADDLVEQDEENYEALNSNSVPTPCFTLPSAKGLERLLVLGHIYKVNRRTGFCVYWRCEFYRKAAYDMCSGKVKTMLIDDRHVVVNSSLCEHSHPPTPANQERYWARMQAQQQLCDESIRTNEMAEKEIETAEQRELAKLGTDGNADEPVCNVEI